MLAIIFSIFLGLFTPVGTVDTNSSPLSREERYTTVFHQKPEASKHPDRKLFTVVIHDNVTNHEFQVASGAEILAFKWSHGNAFTFVKNDNVFYASSPAHAPIQVTHSTGGILHGSYDGVNQEDIVGYDKVRDGAMLFSPSDKFLFYASRAAHSSKEVIITTYTRGSAYDYEYKMEYPKTGEERAAVYNVSIWSVAKKKSVTMDVQLRDKKSFHYLFGSSWVVLHGKEFLLATWANRWQNVTSLTLCSYETAVCSLIKENKYEPRQWAIFEDYQDIVYSDSAIFFILPEPIGNNSWQHVAKVEVTPDFRFSSLSFPPAGEYDVRRVVGYRSKEDVIIYEAQAPNPWNRHVYASPAGGKSVLKEARCLTCSHANCTYQESAKIASSSELSIQFECQGPSPPFEATITFNATLDQEGMEITKPPAAEDLALPHREWTIETFVLPSGFEAIARIYHGDPKLASAPVTLYVYGGPEDNLAIEQFQSFPRPIGYKYAIVTVDVRGSNGRGWQYRSEVYGRLVTVEVEDTLEAMKLILAKYPRLDKQRVGVAGSSNGGAMTAALVEAAPAAFFKCAISVAPVVNFIYYNMAYTERYMGDTPLASYTDLTKDVSKFRNTSLMLVHGLRDDNVHFQNAAILMESLQQANIQFETMVYPNQAHGLFNGDVKDHMIHMLDRVLTRCYA